MIEDFRERPKRFVSGFIDFIRERGVVGLAIGFIIGGAVTKLVSSLVGDILNPVIGVALGRAESLKEASLWIGGTQIMWGSFVSNLLDFVLIALVVYFGFKILRIEKFEKSSK